MDIDTEKFQIKNFGHWIGPKIVLVEKLWISENFNLVVKILKILLKKNPRLHMFDHPQQLILC